MFSSATLLALALALAPWDSQPLQANAEDVARAAAALPAPAGATVDVLLQESTYVFDEHRRCTSTYRLVYRPLTREAAERWSQVQQMWTAGTEERPEIRARVISRRGEVHVLDPATLSDAGADAPQDKFFTDRHVLRGPLPATEAGAVVEQVITLRESALPFEGGIARTFQLGLVHPIRRARLRIEAARGVTLRWSTRGGVDRKVRQQVQAGRQVIEVEWTDVPAQKPVEPWTPPELVTAPQLIFTTGSTWRSVAARYDEIVERQLAGEDLTASARAVASSEEPVTAAAQKLLEWMSARVRYTGLELGEHAVVPARPSQTLSRRFGDCKDLSLLLVGLLRATGRPATLALLRTNGGDVHPDLPGLGQFDHAVVYLPGPRPMFIDPTDPSTPVGELPVQDQGRLALVISGDTVGLVKTPEAASHENRVRTLREIVLPEYGLASVVESTELQGAPAASLRRRRRHPPGDASNEKAIETQALKRYFVTDGVVSTSYRGVDDVRSPVEVQHQAAASRWGVTADDAAEVATSPDALFPLLPGPLQPRAEKDRGAAAEVAVRERDVWVPEPYTAELRYRIVPPPGFRVAALPPSERRPLGPFAFESAFREEQEGVVTGVLRLEVGARRIRAADAKVARDAIELLLHPGPTKISFRRTSAVLLDAGKGRLALDEIRRLAALHPSEARHHSHLALALLRLGMGDAARQEARRAVDLEPRSAWSHRVLANALAHDLMGRPLSPGCDLDGAIAAQRRAVELEPAPAARARLAFLLGHDARCGHFAPGARLEEAIRHYRAVREELKSVDYDDEYVATLAEAGRWKEARALALSMREGTPRNAALLAATAVLEGAGPAAEVTARLSPVDRAAALQAAVRYLARKRLYSLTAALLHAGSVGASASAELQSRAALFDRLKRREDVPLDRKKPADIPRRLFRLILDDSSSGGDDLLAHDLGTSSQRELASASEAAEQGLRQNAAGLPRSVLLDFVESLLEARLEGDADSGWRIRVTVPGAPSPITFYAFSDRGTLRVIGMQPQFAGLAVLARRRVDAGDLSAARRLLAWAREEAGHAGRDDAAAVLAALWTHGAQADVGELRTGALALEGFGLGKDAIAPLERMRLSARGGPTSWAVTWALAAAYRGAKRWAEVLSLADDADSGTRGSALFFDTRALALFELRKDAVLRGAAEERLRREPQDLGALRWISQLATRAGDYADSERYLRRVAESGRAQAADYANLVWACMLQPTLSPDAIAQARRAVQLTGEHSSAALQALSAVHAAQGELAEALQVLRKSVEAGSGELDLIDWLVLGRIAQGYGLSEQASAAYHRVTAAEPTLPTASAAPLARKWSQGLGTASSR